MTLFRFLALAFCMYSVSQLAALEWVPHEAPAVDAQPQIPFSKSKPDKPQLSLKEHEHPADVYLWASIQALHIQVDVQDAAFTPSADRKWLWKNDCLYLEIDGHGDNPDKVGFGKDDIKLFFALSADGPVATVSSHGHHYLQGPLDVSSVNLHYDEDKKLFTYKIALPWKYLNTAPGLHGSIAIAVNVAHKGEKKTDNVMGGFSQKKKKTRGLIPLTMGKPSGDFFFSGGFEEQPLLSPHDDILIPISLHSRNNEQLLIQLGKKDLKVDVRGNAYHGGFVRVSLSDVVSDKRLHMKLWGQVEQHLFTTLPGLHKMIIERLDASDLSNPIAAMHVDSLRVLATDCLNRSRVLHHNDINSKQNVWLSQIISWQKSLLSNLPSTGFDLQAHLKTGRPLALAFVSEADGSLQFATLQIPADYNPAQAEPLVCYLHGAGPRKPVDYLKTLESNKGQDTLWLEGDDPKVLQSAQRDCILVSPYGRGTQSYKGMAEADVWQVLKIVEERFTIETARRYITGFSMGCSGSFSLAARNPDYWAAVNLSAGFHKWGFTWDEKLYANVADLPLIIWCGDADKRMFKGLNQLLPKWKELNFNIQHVETPKGVVHTYPYYAYSDMLKRCFAFQQGNIEEFRCQPRAYDGITYRPQSRFGFAPLYGKTATSWDDVSFRVSHKDNTFNIFSTGPADGFHIDPAQFGRFATSRHPESHVIIRWNDKDVYAGSLDKAITVREPKPEPKPEEPEKKPNAD